MDWQRKSKKNTIEIFSTYGPEPGKKTDKKKMIDDFHNAIEYAAAQGATLSKWLLVINFELSTEFKNELFRLTQKNNVDFEEINPTRILTKIDTIEKIFLASCYFNAVYAPDFPYSDFSNHRFVERALKDLAEGQISKGTDEKLTILKEINSTILKFSFVKQENMSHYLSRNILIYTRIAEEFCYTYKLIDGKFVKVKDLMNGEDTLQRGVLYTCDLNYYTLHVKNLHLLWKLCKELTKQVQKTGSYDINKALSVLYKRRQLFKNVQ